MANQRIVGAEARKAHVRHMHVMFARSIGFAAALLTVALMFGILGYHWVARLPWIDALLNASMILTGMGPVDVLKTDAAKIFASAYALFSGVVFLSATGIVMAPIVHRVLHRFHVERGDG
jgi:hypothetical protein